MGEVSLCLRKKKIKQQEQTLVNLILAKIQKCTGMLRGELNYYSLVHLCCATDNFF